MQTTSSPTASETAPTTVQPTGCCPPFDPSTWQDREITWEDEPFIATHVKAMFHVPLDMSKRVAEAQALIEAADAAPPEPLMLCDESSIFGTELFIHVTGPVPGARMTALSGKYLTHVYEGPYSNAKTWAHDLTARVEASGRALEKLYFAYTTCPRCAKAYGRNYVIGFAKLREPHSAHG